MFRELFGNTVYVRVRVNGFRIRHIERKKELEVSATEPFSHERMLIGSFSNGVNALKTGMRKIFEGSVFQPSPLVVIHPLDKLEGGLTEVEERALKELALSAGARRALVWVGEELSDAEVVSKVAVQK